MRGMTKGRAEYIAAGRIGCTIEEYRQRRAAGLRWCGGCKSWLPYQRKGYCPSCMRRYAKSRYVPRKRPTGLWLVLGEGRTCYGAFPTEALAEAEAQRLRTGLDSPPPLRVEQRLS